MKQYAVNYLNYVTALEDEYNRNASALKANDRGDEAVLFRVRTNICDIFSKMVNATDKKIEALRITDEEEKTRKFNADYLTWFEKIPESWKTNLELARKHNDPVAARTEEVKLDTANLLREKFLEFAKGALPEAKEAVQ